MGKWTFNPFTGNFDYYVDTVTEDAPAPSMKPDGYFSVVNEELYWFTGSNRYKVTGALAPDLVTGNPIGLLLALTYKV